MKNRGVPVMLTVLALAGLFSAPGRVFAHCDTMGGPVIAAAQKALETGNVNLVLIWVTKEDEAEIKNAFARALAVRKLGAEARELADTYFFETLVRVHRASEGAPYTGLKPAGTDLGPAVPAADKALETGSADALLKLLIGTIQEGVRERFKEAMARKNFKPDAVTAGREYVEAYVVFLHYVEGIYEASRPPEHGHRPKERHEEHAK